jgi:S1-C subfamily serine protease
MERSIRAYTVRVRSVRCDEGGTGTGFLIDPRTVVTNRHVVETSRRVEVSTWDGDELPVASVEQATGPDLAIIHLAADYNAVAAPKLAAKNAKVGTKLYIVGYPEGRAPRGTTGVVTRYGKKGELDVPFPFGEMSGNIFPGNSGSPVVDKLGRVVGVAFALELQNGWVGMVPVSELHALLDGGARVPVAPTC